MPEVRDPGESPEDYVLRLAKDKSVAGWNSLDNKDQSMVLGADALSSGADALVLGADTIVLHAGEVLEKPESELQGKEMLTKLSGRVHQVLTAVSCVSSQGLASCLVKTDVQFRAISEAEIEQYWLTGEPVDKAGGYGIQGLGAVFVEKPQWQLQQCGWTAVDGDF